MRPWILSGYEKSQQIHSVSAPRSALAGREARISQKAFSTLHLCYMFAGHALGTRWMGVICALSAGVKSTPLSAGVKSTPLKDYTRVDCGWPRIHLGVDPELNPRGILRRLPESIPPSQNIPLFLTSLAVRTIWINPSLLKYTSFSTNLHVRPSQNLPLPPRIYPPF